MIFFATVAMLMGFPSLRPKGAHPMKIAMKSALVLASAMLFVGSAGGYYLNKADPTSKIEFAR